MKRRLLSLLITSFCLGIVPLISQAVFTSCPSDITVNLSPGKCDTVLNYTVTATGTAPVTVQQLLGIPSGATFPIGTHFQRFTAVDGIPSSALCEFYITVNGFRPNTSALVCDDTVHVSLPPECIGYIFPDHVLEGNYGCDGDFLIDVNSTGLNVVDTSMLNKHVMYSITNTLTQNTCMGWILVEDKMPPFFDSCGTDTIYNCQDKRPVSQGGLVPDPVVTDCSSFNLIYVDTVYQGSCTDPYSSLILRRWEAMDKYGRKSTCVQTIIVLRISLNTHTPVCPPAVQIECVPGRTPDFRPEITGYPQVLVDGTYYDIHPASNSQCRLSSTYSDNIVQMCGASFMILRTWKVVDCCLPGIPGLNPWSCMQIIEYKDTTAPALELIPEINVSLQPDKCFALPNLPPVIVTDCSSTIFEFSSAAGNLYTNGGKLTYPGLPVGDHVINIRVTDACSNATDTFMIVKVRDTQKPVAACKQFMVVALNAQGIGVAAASAFNLGSNDNCCLDSMKVRRMSDNCGNPLSTQFRDFAEFCCADVGKPVQVVFRVYDCHGNYNECMLTVEVQDQLPPQLTCPSDISLDCRNNYLDLEVTGKVVFNIAQQKPGDGLAIDNCMDSLKLEHYDVGSVTCGSGVLFRNFKLTDKGGFDTVCIQRITIQPGTPLTNNDFVFPPDITVGNCGPGTATEFTGDLILPGEGACSDFTVVYRDSVVNNTLGYCQVVFRKWIIIDLCRYNPNLPVSPGRWEHTQIIRVDDKTPPVISDCLPRKFCAFKDNCGFIAPNLSISATDNCSPYEQISYFWVVDLYDDGIPDAGIIYSGNGQNTENFYDYGTHRISYFVSDGCGNTSICSYLFTIEDCKKPNVLCAPYRTVQLQASGSVSVNSRLLDTGLSRDNCTPQNQLRFSFTPKVTDTLRTYTCLDKGANPVVLWITDLTNNQDSCNSYIIVEDSQYPCQAGMLAFGGRVSTESNNGVRDVTMQLSGSMAGMAYTDTRGEFKFASIPSGKDYTLTPAMNDHPLNGVTTYDMVLLQRHILGVEPLNSPYKVIAGDVNRNNVLTTSDLVDLRRVILHILPQFPNNTSWRFIDGTQLFQDNNNPFATSLREIYNVNNLSPNSPKPAFVAVKVGDVNGSAIGANLLSGVDGRSRETELIINTIDKDYVPGEIFQVDFTSQIQGLLAYQFTLNFDKSNIEVVEMIPGFRADMSNFGMTLLDDGAITASWGQVKEYGQPAREILFSLRIKAKHKGRLSDVLSINSRFTHSEAFDASGDKRDIKLRFDNGNPITNGRFELLQNMPNPFTDKTVIGFELPEPSSAVLTIFDVAGKRLWETKGEFAKGYNEINLDGDKLLLHGILYYRLETPLNTATRKMTFLR